MARGVPVGATTRYARPMTTADPTLLQRVILPRSGDPMSVRALYMDERTGLALATVPALPGATVHNPGAPRGLGGHRAAAAGDVADLGVPAWSRARCRSGRTSTPSPPATGGTGRR